MIYYCGNGDCPEGKNLCCQSCGEFNVCPPYNTCSSFVLGNEESCSEIRTEPPEEED